MPSKTKQKRGSSGRRSHRREEAQDGPRRRTKRSISHSEEEDASNSDDLSSTDSDSESTNSSSGSSRVRRRKGRESDDNDSQDSDSQRGKRRHRKSKGYNRQSRRKKNHSKKKSSEESLTNDSSDDSDDDESGGSSSDSIKHVSKSTRKKKHESAESTARKSRDAKKGSKSYQRSETVPKKKGELVGKSIPVFSEEPPALDEKFSASGGSGKHKYGNNQRLQQKDVSTFLYDDAESTPGKKYPFPFQQEEQQLRHDSTAVAAGDVNEHQYQNGYEGEHKADNAQNEQSLHQLQALMRQVESLQQDCRAKDDLIDALQQLESNSVRQQEDVHHSSQEQDYGGVKESTYPGYGEYQGNYTADDANHGYQNNQAPPENEEENLQTRLENAENAAAQAETRVMSLERQLEAANVENKMLQEQYEATKNDAPNEGNSEEVERLKERVRQLEHELSNARSERDSDMYRFNQLQSRLDDANQRYSMTAEQVSLLQDENRQLRSQVQDLLQKNHRLQQDYDQLKVSSANNSSASSGGGNFMPKLSQPASFGTYSPYDNPPAVGTMGGYNSGSTYGGPNGTSNNAMPQKSYYPYQPPPTGGSAQSGGMGFPYNSGSGASTNVNYGGASYDKYAGNYQGSGRDPPQGDARTTLAGAAQGQLFQGETISRSTCALPGIYDSAAASFSGLPKGGSVSSHGSSSPQTGFGFNPSKASSAGAPTTHANSSAPASGMAEHLRSLQEQAKARESERLRKKEHTEDIASRQRAAPFATEASSEAHKDTAQRKEKELMNLNLEKNQLTSELDKLGPGEPRTIEGRRKKREHEKRLEEVDKELSQLRYWLKKYEAQQHA